MIQTESKPRNQANVLLNAPPVRIQIETSLLTGTKHPLINGKFIFSSSCTSLTSRYRWLYFLILTIDANFRLKNKERKTVNDSPLGDGWGHWVPRGPYQEYIQKYGYQAEVCPRFLELLDADYLFQPNICDSNLRAVDHANTKYSQGYRSTGAGAVVCGRHGLVRKNGLGDLQKGERCVLMDRFRSYLTMP